MMHRRRLPRIAEAEQLPLVFLTVAVHVLEHIGHAFGAFERRRVGDLEMQVRGGGVSRLAERADDLASRDDLTGFYRDAAPLQMRLAGEVAAAQVDHDVVAEQAVQ